MSFAINKKNQTELLRHSWHIIDSNHPHISQATHLEFSYTDLATTDCTDIICTTISDCPTYTFGPTINHPIDQTSGQFQPRKQEARISHLKPQSSTKRIKNFALSDPQGSYPTDLVPLWPLPSPHSGECCSVGAEMIQLDFNIQCVWEEGGVFSGGSRPSVNEGAVI